MKLHSASRVAVACLAATVSLPLAAQSINLSGYTLTHQGLVGVGRMPANHLDKFGETFGSFSAFTVDSTSWQRRPDGSYSGVLYTQPDRGYNAANTTNYTPRYNVIDFNFTPDADGASAQNQVALTLTESVKYHEANGTPLTSLDPTVSGVGTRPNFPALPQAFNGRLSLDAEGIVKLKDGTFFVSDEYGPYVYRFASDGTLLGALRPPEALIPKRAGADSFSSNTPGAGQPVPSPGNPVTGRQNNQGLEGLSLSPDGNTLFALLQSATRQDGGTGGTGPRQNTRLLTYDLSAGYDNAVLKGEYIVQLPSFLDGANSRVAAQSEIVAISSTEFLMLARDGNGLGTANPTSNYRNILAVDIAGATNILGTIYDGLTPVAPGGNLVSAVTPGTTKNFFSINDPAELAKFGLKNGPTNDANNLSEKWEALSLLSALDPNKPNDYFLFVGNDNDFLTRNGTQAGLSYDAGVENDSMVLVYRVSMQPIPEPSTYAWFGALGLGGLVAFRRLKRK